MEESDSKSNEYDPELHDHLEMQIDKDGIAQFRQGEIRAPSMILAKFYETIDPNWPVDLVKKESMTEPSR